MRPAVLADDAVPEGYERVVLGASQPQYQPLPAVVGPAPERITVMLWEVDEDELRAIVQHRVVALAVFTYGHPFQPVLLYVPPANESGGDLPIDAPTRGIALREEGR
jgi:hypothetical protein